MKDETLFKKTIDAIDTINSQDPNTESLQEQDFPKELLYSRRMTARLQLFEPEASELLQIAARAQHIKRWAIPRSDYPMDRAGYKKWRTELARFHAELTGDLMQQVGYGRASIERVQSLLQKKKLKQDPECQILEDVICLVFIEHYLEAFAGSHNEDKIISIIQKTWRKMSQRGQQAALGLELTQPISVLLKKALT
jgi:hypothetical protein